MALTFQIKVDDSGTPRVEALGKSIKSVGDSAAKAESGLSKMGGTLEKMVAGGAALTAFGKFVSAADEEDRAIARLKRSVEGLGMSYETVSASVSEMTKRNQQNTAFSDDEQISVLAELTALVGDYNKAVAVLPDVMDLAAFQQKDLTAAMDDYVMLMNGDAPKSLGRFIPILKEMEKAGMSSAVMMDEVRKRTQGAASVDVSGLTKLKNNMGEMAESAGKYLLPAVDTLNAALTAMPTALQGIIAIAPAVALAFKTMGGPLGLVVTGIATLATFIRSDILKGKADLEAYNKLASGEAKSLKDIGMTREQAQARIDAMEKTIQRVSSPGAAPPSEYYRKKNDELKKAQSELQRLLFQDKAGEIIGSQGATVNKIVMPNMAKRATFGQFSGFDFGISAGPMSSIAENQKALDAAAQGETARLERMQTFSDKQVELLQAEQDSNIEMMTDGFEQQLVLEEMQYEQRLSLLETYGISTVEATARYNKAVERIETERASNYLGLAGDMIGGMARLNQAMKGNATVTKTLAMFETTINTAAAIMKFMVSPGGIPGAVMSVTAGITGAAQLATIAAAKMWSGGWGEGRGGNYSDSIPTMISRGERVISNDEVNRNGGRAAIDRAISAGAMNSGGVNVIVNGPIMTAKNYVRDFIIPEIKYELARV